MILAIGNGTTYYYLDGGTSPNTFVRDHFEPARPKLSASEIKQHMSDGGELHELSRENVSETVTVALVGNGEEIRDFIRKIETALMLASEHATQYRGAAWYVYYDPTATVVGNAYRSQILYGSVEILDSNYSGGYAIVAVEYQRRFYLEGVQTELALSNGHGSTSSGKTIYNDDDATYDDWVTISGSEIGGVLPTPILFHYTNEWTDRVYRIYTGLAVWGGKTQAAVRRAWVDADYSVSSWSGDAETRIANWAISSSDLDTFTGRYYRVLMHLGGYVLNGTWVRVKLMLPASTPLTTIYEGDLVELNSGVKTQDLGVVQIPPWLPGETGLEALALSLWGRKIGGGSLNGDYLKLLPADAYRELIPAGYGSYMGTRVVDDQITDRLWNEAGDGTDKTGHYYVRGNRQYLWPGMDATLYVKTTTSSRTMTDAIQGAVRVYYRPRRLSV